MKKNLIFLLAFLCVASNLFAQQMKVSGVVKSSDENEPLIGVNISVKGTTRGVVTDLDGKYTINVSADEKLTFQYVGYSPITMVVKKSQTVLNVTLTPDSKMLQEVVAVGYGYQKKSLVTGAIASLSSKEMDRSGLMRADEALQGKAAGVTVMANSGQPGEAMSIRIRGIGTNGNASPLYIVDGTSTDNIEFLNPRDIESMEVLKDAASSAIYGARGANGVVMITTKKGKIGDKMSIRYDYNYGIQNLRKKMDLLDARSYAIIQNEAAFNGGQTLPFSAADMAKLGKGTDWQEEILNKNAPIENHQITLAGGAEKSAYNISASYFNQEGIFAPGKSNFDRWTFRESTDHNYWSDKLKVGQSLTLSMVNKKGIDPNNIFSGPIMAALNIDPITPVKNEDGTYGESNYISQEVVNPVAKLAVSFGSYKYTRILANAYAELALLKDLKFKSTVASELFFDQGWGYSPTYRLNSAQINTVTGTNKTSSDMQSLTYENTLTFSPTISEKHAITAMVGNTLRTANGSNLGGSKQGLLVADPYYAYLDLAKNETSAKTWGGAWHNALVSYFGRLNYTYTDKYMFTATMRADGSTRFGSNNRFGYFPSVSAGWNISNESFLKDSPAIETLKLRASWGQNGNESIGDWQYLATISSGARGYTFNDVIYPGASPAKVANPDLRWETSEQFNIGVDTRILKKFNASVDYYVKSTKDLLIYAPIPTYVGAPAAATNAGLVQNKGVEFLFGYNDHTRDFSWNVDFNISFNKNEVLEVGNEDGWIGGASVGTAMTNVTRMAVGKPISYFWGFETNGIFQNKADVTAHTNSTGKIIQPDAMPGDFRFNDLNDDGVIDDKDRTMIGNPNPDFTAGLTVGLTWKNWSISSFFSGMYGNDIFNGSRRWDFPMSNYQSDVLNRWIGEGTSNTYPRVTTTDLNKNFTRPSSFFVQDGSFVRLKNLTLGYNFKGLQKYMIQSLKLYVSATNLFTLTKYNGLDPEIGSYSVLSSGIDYGVYPQPRTYTVGASISF
ncbi:MAG: TonB-dependent receptor [Bacteroidales bacterium]|nr:TonB-dependent receptor [Bacteroidales bacterium]